MPIAHGNMHACILPIMTSTGIHHILVFHVSSPIVTAFRL